MTAETKLLVDILSVLQACCWTTAFGATIAEVVDTYETKSFRSISLTVILWLFVGMLLTSVCECIGNLISG